MSTPVFGSTPQADAPTITQGQPLQADPVRGLVNGINALYRHSRSIIFSDFRDETLEGVYNGYAPWYCDPYSLSPPWQARIFRLPYRPGSPLPGSDTGVKTTGGTAKLLVWVRGRNIDINARITRVSAVASDGTYTLGTTAFVTGFIAYGTGFSEQFFELLFPDNSRSGDLFMIDFYWTSRNDEEDAEGYLSGLCILEDLHSDWPSGSTP